MHIALYLAGCKDIAQGILDKHLLSLLGTGKQKRL